MGRTLQKVGALTLVMGALVACSGGTMDQPVASGGGGEGAAGGGVGVGGAGGEGGAEVTPVDCSAIEAHADWELCASSPTSCEAVFTDSAGCAAVCAAVGLPCAEVYEDVPDACAPDTSLPALGCEPASGHISDYCVCGAPTPSSCGDGSCDGGETCTSCEVDCGACPPTDYKSLVEEAVGFARPTGGRDGPRVFVTTTAASGPGSLAEALAIAGPKWISFDAGLSGSITPNGTLSVPADTTIDGRGADITLTRGLTIVGTDRTNIIIENLKFAVTGSDDGVQIRNGADEVWVDHCSFDQWGDGAVDVTNGIANVMTKVTVSWSRLTGGSKGMLISATSDPSFGWVDENLYVTHHHNYYTGVLERTPRTRFAKVHTFNNVAHDWGGYAVGASTLAEILVENNVFDAGANERACRTACIGDDCMFHGGVGGAVRASGNLLDQGSILAVCETASPSIVLDEFPGAAPPYPYTLEVADGALRQAVESGAGWRSVPLPD